MGLLILFILILVGLYLLYKYIAEEDPKKKQAYKIVLMVDAGIVAIIILLIVFTISMISSHIPF